MTILLLFLSILSSGAQQLGECATDQDKFCQGMPPGPDRLRCLVQNEDKVSPACKVKVAELKKNIPVGARSAPFIPMGPMGLMPAEVATLTYSGWWAPEGDDRALQNRLGFQMPVRKTEQSTLAGGLNGSRLHVERQPRALSTLDFSLHYSRKLEGRKSLGGRLSVGSASDHIFANSDVTTYTGTVDYSFPKGENGRWLLAAFLSNNSPILNYVPIPTVAYIYAQKKFSGVFGLPFLSLRWMPSEAWALSVGAFGTNLNSEVTYGSPRFLQLFAGYNQGSQSFILRDRVEDRDRYYYREKRVQGGARFPLVKNITADVTAGYAFDREFLTKRGLFSSGRSQTTELDSSGFVQTSVRATF